MEKQHVVPFVIMLMVGITGCAGHTVDKAWPEPRPRRPEAALGYRPHIPLAYTAGGRRNRERARRAVEPGTSP